MMSDGLNCPTLAIPMPAFAVPYAAPRAVEPVSKEPRARCRIVHVQEKTMAEATPANPKKDA